MQINFNQIYLTHRKDSTGTTTTLGQSEPGSNGKENVLYTS